MNEGLTQRPALSLGVRRADRAGRSNLYGLHEEEAMTKGISSAHFNPANLWRRANFTRFAHRGVDIAAMKLSRSERERCGFRDS